MVPVPEVKRNSTPNGSLGVNKNVEECSFLLLVHLRSKYSEVLSISCLAVYRLLPSELKAP